MDKEQGFRDLIKKAESYLDIERDSDFEEFKEKIITPRLGAYILDAISSDVSTEEGKQKALRALTRYQELSYVSREVFAAWKQTAEASRENLEKIKGS